MQILSLTWNACLPWHIEEAVNEVKRQAMDEVQKAVAEAEQKAFEMISAERAKMEKTLVEAKRKAQEDAIMVINEQEDSSEVSWDVDYGANTLWMDFCPKRDSKHTI